MSSNTSTETTRELRRRMDEFLAEFEDEFRAQATKVNSTSEKRMRKLLRGLRPFYEWYRDASIADAKARETERHQKHPF